MFRRLAPSGAIYIYIQRMEIVGSEKQKWMGNLIGGRNTKIPVSKFRLLQEGIITRAFAAAVAPLYIYSLMLRLITTDATFFLPVLLTV